MNLFSALFCNIYNYLFNFNLRMEKDIESQDETEQLVSLGGVVIWRDIYWQKERFSECLCCLE